MPAEILMNASPNPAGWRADGSREVVIDFAMTVPDYGGLANRYGWVTYLSGADWLTFADGQRPIVVGSPEVPSEPGAVVAGPGLKILRARGTPPVNGVYTITATGTFAAGMAVIFAGTPTIQYVANNVPIRLAATPLEIFGITVPGAVTELSWFQASALATAGARIHRAGWSDRYLEHSNSLWYLQLVNPVTKVAGVRAVVQSTDWNEQHFRARDWVSEGQVDPAAFAAALAITTVFP